MKDVLKAKVERYIALSNQDKERMYHLMTKYYDNMTWEQFLEDLSQKQNIIIMRDTINRQIQGFSTILKIDREIDGKRIRGIFSGDTIVEKKYWGQRVLGKTFGTYCFMQKLKNPFRPFYWFLISKGYKTYLLMANNCSHHFPHFSRPTPTRVQKILDTVYGELYPNYFNKETGLIKFKYEACHLKQGIAEPTAKLLQQNPRARFFALKNPEWQKGTELACVADMKFRTVLLYPVKSMIKLTSKKINSLTQLVLNPKTIDQKREA